jgi:hypothetical protein
VDGEDIIPITWRLGRWLGACGVASLIMHTLFLPFLLLSLPASSSTLTLFLDDSMLMLWVVVFVARGVFVCLVCLPLSMLSNAPRAFQNYAL